LLGSASCTVFSSYPSIRSLSCQPGVPNVLLPPFALFPRYHDRHYVGPFLLFCSLQRGSWNGCGWSKQGNRWVASKAAEAQTVWGAGTRGRGGSQYKTRVCVWDSSQDMLVGLAASGCG
jgi:hypothetical protein